MSKRPVSVLNFRRYWRYWALKKPTTMEAASERYGCSRFDSMRGLLPIQNVDGFSCRHFYYEHQ